jgi:hypothetical protein
VGRANIWRIVDAIEWGDIIDNIDTIEKMVKAEPAALQGNRGLPI